MTTRYLMAALIALFAGLIILPSAVFSQSDFYKGKTITIIQGRDRGGTGDMRVRTIILFLQKCILETQIAWDNAQGERSGRGLIGSKIFLPC